MTSIAYTEGDPVALAKALAKYAKDNPEFTFKAGVVEGRVVTVKEIEALATMPSKEEIYSKLLFLLNAPAQRLVTVMNATGRDLAVVAESGRAGEEVQRGVRAATGFWLLASSQKLASFKFRTARAGPKKDLVIVSGGCAV